MLSIWIDEHRWFVIDDEDYPWASRVKWYLHKGYIVTRRLRPGSVYLHREILHCPDGLYVDHINGDKLDNRRLNLRIVTHRQNCRNKGMSTNNTSGFKGVQSRDGDKWDAMIRYNGKTKHIGRFGDPTIAARAYDQAARTVFGNHARTNKKLGLL